MTFEEFFTLDKKELKTLDNIAGYILKNKKLKLIVLTNIVYINMACKVYADDFEALRVGKNEIVIALQICISSLCVVMCLLEIGKSLIGGRSSDIGNIVMKYLAGVCGVGIVPIAFKMIAKMFKINI